MIVVVERRSIEEETATKRTEPGTAPSRCNRTPQVRQIDLCAVRSSGPAAGHVVLTRSLSACPTSAVPLENRCPSPRRLIHPASRKARLILPDGPLFMLRSLYDWTISLARHRHAMTALVLVAFAESSIFPIPVDVLLIPMVLAARDKAWRIASVCTVASVLGGLAGYGIGYGLFEAVGKPILEFYGAMPKFEEFRHLYNEWGAWIVIMGGITPFPYKVITIASGATRLDPLVFIVASIVARSLRFFIVAGAIWYFGPPIRGWLERNLGLATTIFFILLIGGFLVIEFVV
jgi:membrane protein YqaA with SNARE-associated domain